MIKLYDIIFCDDIRNEIGNKLSLMGIYNDRLVFSNNKQEKIKWPIPLSLAILLRFTREINDIIPNKFVFEYILNEKKIANITGSIKIENSHSYINLSLKGQGIPLVLGNLGFYVELFKDEKSLFSQESKSALKIIEE